VQGQKLDMKNKAASAMVKHAGLNFTLNVLVFVFDVVPN